MTIVTSLTAFLFIILVHKSNYPGYQYVQILLVRYLLALKSLYWGLLVGLHTAKKHVFAIMQSTSHM